MLGGMDEMRCVATMVVLAMALAACETNPEPQAAEDDLSALLSETTSFSETVDEPATTIPVTTTAERPDVGSGGGWTTLPEAPIDPRSEVGSVWTGEEFIVWGGGRTRSNPAGYASDGAAYNPETGEWRVLAESPLTGRLWHIMVVIDGEVLVLGGDTGFADDSGASGAFYDPETDTWRDIAPAPYDAPISWSVWTGEELLVEGHTYADPPDPSSVLMVYDPGSDSWSQRPVPDNIGRTWVNDRWFGWEARPPPNEPQGPLRGFAYDPGTDEVEQLPPAPIPTREMQSTIWTGEEIIVVAGYGPRGRLSDGAAYNPATKKWREIAPMPIEGRVWNHALWSGSEVLIFGGAAGSSGAHEEYSDGAAYHPETDTWRLLPNLPTSAGGTAVYAPEHGVILWTTSGGFMLDGEAIAGPSDTPGPVVSAPQPNPTSSNPVADVAVASFPVDEEIRLRVLATRPNNLSLAVIDFEVGRTTVYPPGLHSLPLDASDGAVMTPTRDWILWGGNDAWLLPSAPDGPVETLEPEIQESHSGIAPALRVIPTPEGDRVWVVQPGSTYANNDWPTLIELEPINSGEPILQVEADGEAFPVAATNNGLVLNHSTLFDTGDGWAVRPGSEKVTHLLEDGTTVDVGDGIAIAASGTRIARLMRQEDRGSLRRGNELVISDVDGSREIEVSKPFPGIWFHVGGPGVPSDAMPLQTVSPDGSELLVGLARRLDVNNMPVEAVLVAVDLATGETRVTSEERTLLANWSADGQWIATHWRSEITLINSSDPQTILRFENIVPADHFVLAAG